MEFQPDTKLRTKYTLQLLTLPLIFFIFLVVPLSIFFFLFFTPFPGAYQLWLQFLFWGFVFCFIWIVPGLIAIPFYVARIRYFIRDDEIMVKRGIVTITQRVVPTRAITNVSLRRGPYDRLLGIGSVKIETAGQMGTQAGTPSPEVALDGLIDYDKINNHILTLIRRYRSGYALTTEVEREPVDETTFLLQKILSELQKLNETMERK